MNWQGIYIPNRYRADVHAVLLAGGVVDIPEAQLRIKVESYNGMSSVTATHEPPDGAKQIVTDEISHELIHIMFNYADEIERRLDAGDPNPSESIMQEEQARREAGDLDTLYTSMMNAARLMQQWKTSDPLPTTGLIEFFTRGQDERGDTVPYRGHVATVFGGWADIHHRIGLDEDSKARRGDDPLEVVRWRLIDEESGK